MASAATFSATDDFSSYATGAITGGFGTNWSGNWVLVNSGYQIGTTAMFKNVGKALSRALTSGSPTASIERTLASSADSGDLYFAFMVSGASAHVSQFMINSGASTGLDIEIWGRNNNGTPVTLLAVGASGVVPIATGLSFDTWYIVNVSFTSATTCKIRYKALNGLFGYFTAPITYMASVSSPNLLKINSSSQGTGNTTFYFDEISNLDPDDHMSPIQTGEDSYYTSNGKYKQVIPGVTTPGFTVPSHYTIDEYLSPSGRGYQVGYTEGDVIRYVGYGAAAAQHTITSTKRASTLTKDNL